MNREEEINIECFDEESLKKDDLIGTAIVFLDGIKKKRKSSEQVKLLFKGKEAGIVL